MGFCKQRYFMLTVCLLQIVSIAQRQVFDFLGYLWIPILVNFFQIIFVIFGFYGTFQYRPKYIISYTLWHLFYLGWNVFLICLYLDIGILDHRQNIVIKLDPDSYTWWSQYGPGCQGALNVTGSVPLYEDKNCFVDYRYIEVFQAGLQCFLAFFGILSGLCLSKTFLEEDDSFNYISGDGKHPRHLSLRPMYVDSASMPLHPFAFPRDADSTLSLHSSFKQRPKIHSDLIRFQTKASSYTEVPVRNSEKPLRPKSLHSTPTDAY